MIPAAEHGQDAPSSVADDCGGYGVEHAKFIVRDQNSVLGRAKVLRMFLGVESLKQRR